MALSMHSAEIEKFVAQRVTFAILVQNGLQRKRQLAQLGRLGPSVALFFVAHQLKIREQAPPSARALFQAGHQLVCEDFGQRFKLRGF